MSFYRTTHAEHRMSNRAVTQEAYDATWLFAKSTYSKYEHNKSYYFDKESLRDLKDAYPDVYNRNFKTLKNIELRASVTLEDEGILTVIRKSKRSSKRHLSRVSSRRNVKFT